ncbi:unnamed protein product, partial [Medioppia subpectinata]
MDDSYDEWSDPEECDFEDNYCGAEEGVFWGVVTDAERQFREQWRQRLAAKAAAIAAEDSESTARDSESIAEDIVSSVEDNESRVEDNESLSTSVAPNDVTVGDISAVDMSKTEYSLVVSTLGSQSPTDMLSQKAEDHESADHTGDERMDLTIDNISTIDFSKTNYSMNSSFGSRLSIKTTAETPLKAIDVSVEDIEPSVVDNELRIESLSTSVAANDVTVGDILAVDMSKTEYSLVVSTLGSQSPTDMLSQTPGKAAEVHGVDCEPHVEDNESTARDNESIAEDIVSSVEDNESRIESLSTSVAANDVTVGDISAVDMSKTEYSLVVSALGSQSATDMLSQTPGKAAEEDLELAEEDLESADHTGDERMDLTIDNISTIDFSKTNYTKNSSFGSRLSIKTTAETPLKAIDVSVEDIEPSVVDIDSSDEEFDSSIEVIESQTEDIKEVEAKIGSQSANVTAIDITVDTSTAVDMSKTDFSLIVTTLGSSSAQMVSQTPVKVAEDTQSESITANEGIDESVNVTEGNTSAINFWNNDYSMISSVGSRLSVQNIAETPVKASEVTAEGIQTPNVTINETIEEHVFTDGQDVKRSEYSMIVSTLGSPSAAVAMTETPCKVADNTTDTVGTESPLLTTTEATNEHKYAIDGDMSAVDMSQINYSICVSSDGSQPLSETLANNNAADESIVLETNETMNHNKTAIDDDISAVDLSQMNNWRNVSSVAKTPLKLIDKSVVNGETPVVATNEEVDEDISAVDMSQIIYSVCVSSMGSQSLPETVANNSVVVEEAPVLTAADAVDHNKSAIDGDISAFNLSQMNNWRNVSSVAKTPLKPVDKSVVTEEIETPVVSTDADVDEDISAVDLSQINYSVCVSSMGSQPLPETLANNSVVAEEAPVLTAAEAVDHNKSAIDGDISAFNLSQMNNWRSVSSVAKTPLRPVDNSVVNAEVETPVVATNEEVDEDILAVELSQINHSVSVSSIGSQHLHESTAELSHKVLDIITEESESPNVSTHEESVDGLSPVDTYKINESLILSAFGSSTTEMMTKTLAKAGEERHFANITATDVEEPMEVDVTVDNVSTIDFWKSDYSMISSIGSRLSTKTMTETPVKSLDATLEGIQTQDIVSPQTPVEVVEVNAADLLSPFELNVKLSGRKRRAATPMAADAVDVPITMSLIDLNTTTIKASGKPSARLRPTPRVHFKETTPATPVRPEEDVPITMSLVDLNTTVAKSTPKPVKSALKSTPRFPSKITAPKVDTKDSTMSLIDLNTSAAHKPSRLQSTPRFGSKIPKPKASGVGRVSTPRFVPSRSSSGLSAAASVGRLSGLNRSSSGSVRKSSRLSTIMQSRNSSANESTLDFILNEMKCNVSDENS